MRNILFTLLFTLFCFSNISGQENTIEIKNFSGIFTNGDLEDIPKENMTVLKNFKILNGKLIKTFAFGSINRLGKDGALGDPKLNIFKACSTVAGSQIFNLFTYVHPELSEFESAYYVVYVDTGTNEMSFYGWSNGATTNYWVQVATIDTVYHKEARNPILQIGNAIRFFPGNVGEVSDRVAKTLWMDRIDRKYFDYLYQPAANFYRVEANVIPPSLDYTATTHDSGVFEDDKHYKLSGLYDGVQESLLGGGVTVEIDTLQFVELDFSIKESEHNKRVTAMNVYRSDVVDGAYNLIHTVDFLRDTNTTLSGDSCWNGAYYIYIPGNNVNFEVNYNYIVWLTEDGDSWDLAHIKNPGVGQHDVFGVKDTTEGLSPPFTGKVGFNVEWKIMRDYPGTDVWVGSGKSGAFLGLQVAIMDTNVTATNLSGGVLGFWTEDEDSLSYHYVEAHYKGALLLKSDSLNSTADTTRNWKVCAPSIGNYFIEESNDTVTVKFFDTGLITTEPHPLEGEVSIDVNFKHGAYISGRLFVGDIVLDPGGVAEVHTDWVAYSELEQPDVIPVSNIINFANYGVGKITGVNEFFGNPVFMKKDNLIIVNVKDSPATPSAWGVIESINNIGNIAPCGHINAVGVLYVVHHSGIYGFTPNEFAESGSTPSKRSKISELINDTFEALTLPEKEAVTSQYDHINNEIVYTLGSEIWSFDINTGGWREINSTREIELMCLSEDAEIIVYDSTGNRLYSFGESDSTSCELKTKTFHLSDDNLMNVSHAWITYNSDTKLYVNLFTNNSTIRADFDTLTPSSVDTTVRVDFDEPANKFSLGIVDSTSTDGDSEILKIKVIIQ